MQLNNLQIYTCAEELNIQFQNCNVLLPVKINFFLQKNIQIITAAAQEIAQARLNIAQRFGALDETRTNYIIAPENMVTANNELNDLFSLEQELNIHTFKLSDFDDIALTYQQMSAIMFMIEED